MVRNTDRIHGGDEMYVVSYDIEKDKVRNKVAKTLEGFGKRVQYSVFECRISQDRFDTMYSRLASLMESEENGNIRFYNVCLNCEAKIATIGVASDSMVKAEQDLFII